MYADFNIKDVDKTDDYAAVYKDYDTKGPENGHSGDTTTFDDKKSGNAVSSESSSEASSPKDTNKPLDGKIICIDPGHQEKGNSEQEPVGPNASETKDKVSSGCELDSGVAEYIVTMQIGNLTKKALEEKGATVLMTRESNAVNISNKERAEIANKGKANAVVRIHVDGASDGGMSFYTISPSNPYQKTYNECNSLAKAIEAALVKSTGAKSKGIIAKDDYSGNNWCEVPCVIAEVGDAHNKTDSENLIKTKYQTKIAEGICNGIINFCK
jgi:N-acetylmuramoyl-L-alanine amidase